MLKEEVQTLLSGFGFYETLNKPLHGINTTHMMHRCNERNTFVEYYIDPQGKIKSIFTMQENDFNVFENTSDFETWLKK